jgi:hypothetical protein
MRFMRYCGMDCHAADPHLRPGAARYQVILRTGPGSTYGTDVTWVTAHTDHGYVRGAWLLRCRSSHTPGQLWNIHTRRHAVVLRTCGIWTHGLARIYMRLPNEMHTLRNLIYVPALHAHYLQYAMLHITCSCDAALRNLRSGQLRSQHSWVTDKCSRRTVIRLRNACVQPACTRVRCRAWMRFMRYVR